MQNKRLTHFALGATFIGNCLLWNIIISCGPAEAIKVGEGISAAKGTPNSDNSDNAYGITPSPTPEPTYIYIPEDSSVEPTPDKTPVKSTTPKEKTPTPTPTQISTTTPTPIPTASPTVIPTVTPTPVVTLSPQVSSDIVENLTKVCIDKINELRAEDNPKLPKVKRWTKAEGCATKQAELDFKDKANGRHLNDISIPECSNIKASWSDKFLDIQAQNEFLLGTHCSFDYQGTLNSSIMHFYNEKFNSEANSKSHYYNIVEEEFTKVGCGFYLREDGALCAGTINFNF